MKILSIETSCDETAVAIIEGTGGLENPSFIMLGNALFSQIEMHREYGGVFPTVAKREHAKKLSVLTKEVLKQAYLYSTGKNPSEDKLSQIEQILVREEGLYSLFLEQIANITKPKIDMIAVTYGPGLEPALWVGICFAKAIGLLWDIPVVGANHMEGHIASVLLTPADDKEKQKPIEFPALALLISGGHTELVKIANWGEYELIGQTRDDAVGEAFDKVARMLALPYPGGPEISKLAKLARENNIPKTISLPRPMIHSNDLDFSFSGLKTSVLYTLKNYPEVTEHLKQEISREFEDSVTDVLVSKTKTAIENTGAKTLIVAGGVIANTHIQTAFKKLAEEFGVNLRLPTTALATDNALMIATAAYMDITIHPEKLHAQSEIHARGQLSLNK